MNLIRVAWLSIGLILVAVSVAFGITLGWGSALTLIFFAVLPDVALIGAFGEEGRLRPQRVLLYNVFHSPSLPIGLLLAGVIPLFMAGIAGLCLAGITWLAHIAIDRACGFGLRANDGSIRPVGVRQARTR